MLPQEVNSEVDRIKALFTKFIELSKESELDIHPVYANYMVLKSAGFLEKSVHAILAEYGRRNANSEIKRFLVKTVERENSLNCEKLERIISKLDSGIWETIFANTDIESRSGVDGLKTIRDQIAHGKHNGTSIRTVKNYFDSTLKMVTAIGDALL